MKTALRDACGYWDAGDKTKQDLWFAQVIGGLQKTGLKNQNWIGEGTVCPCGGYALTAQQSDANSICIGTVANRNYFLLLEILQTSEKSEKHFLLEGKKSGAGQGAGRGHDP